LVSAPLEKKRQAKKKSKKKGDITNGAKKQLVLELTSTNREIVDKVESAKKGG